MEATEILARHHRRIENLMNDIEQLKAQESPDHNDIMQCFHKLSHISENYITDEQIYLKHNNSAEFQRHKEAHKKFTDRLLKVHKSCNNDPGCCLETLYELLKEWKNARPHASSAENDD